MWIIDGLLLLLHALTLHLPLAPPCRLVNLPPTTTTPRFELPYQWQLVRLIHDVIGVEVLQVEGPDARHVPPSGSHGFLGGARGLFGGGPFGGGGGGSGVGSGATGLDALSAAMMLQLRPSKDALCKVM